MDTNVERWWNDSDRERHKYWEKNPCKCHFIHRKPHTYWPGNGLKYCNFYDGKITIWMKMRRATFNKAKVVTCNSDRGSATRGPVTYYAARGHICKSRIHYRHSAIIDAVTYTAYRYFPTCGPRTGPQYPVWSFATNNVGYPWFRP